MTLSDKLAGLREIIERAQWTPFQQPSRASRRAAVEEYQDRVTPTVTDALVRVAEVALKLTEEYPTDLVRFYSHWAFIRSDANAALAALEAALEEQE